MEDGAKKLKKLLELSPGMNMSFTFSLQDGCYVLAYDYAKLDVAKLREFENTCKSFSGCYYQYHAVSPDFDSIRKGSIWIVECDGYSYVPRRGDLRYSEEFWNVLGGVYPMKVKSYKCFHTPMLFNIFKTK